MVEHAFKSQPEIGFFGEVRERVVRAQDNVKRSSTRN
jgi:hypothetical protein